MTKVQTETSRLELEIRRVIDNRRSPYLSYAAIVGVLTMIAMDVNREADIRLEKGTI